MKSRMLPSAIVVAVTAVLTVSTTLAAQDNSAELSPRYTVTALSSLGGTFTEANGISNRDWIAGYSNLPGDQYQHATLWRNGVLTDLGTLGGYNSFIFFPVKDEPGFVVGGSETSATDPLAENFCGYGTGLICAGFVWQNGSMTALPTLGGNNGAAVNVNNRGQITGYAETRTADPRCTAPQVLLYEAAVWWPQHGKIQELAPFAGDLTSVGSAINDAGQVAGVSAPGCTTPTTAGFQPNRAVLWDHGSVIDLGTLGGVASNLPFAINNRGQVVGISDVAGDVYQHAFLWTKETGMQDLGTLPGDVVVNALGLNNKTQVVGGSADANNNTRAFLWQNGVMTDLNTLVQPNSGLYLVYAGDINDAGEITGVAVDNAGAVVGFVAVPNHQQPLSPGVAENNASANMVLPERAQGFFRPRGLFGRQGFRTGTGSNVDASQRAGRDFIRENWTVDLGNDASANSCIPVGHYCKPGSQCCSGSFCEGTCCYWMRFTPCTSSDQCCSHLCLNNHCGP